MRHNFGALFRTLAELLRDAASDEDERRRTRRLDRVVDGFIRDYPQTVTRDRVNTMLKEIESSLADSDDDNAVRVAILRIRRDHKLTDSPNTAVEDHARLLIDVRGLKYQERLAMQEAVAAHEPIDDTPGTPERPGSARKAPPRKTPARSAPARRAGRSGAGNSPVK